ncbi:MAG: phosphatidylglycerophosphate synthase, partial [Candidatus Azotimanducaceae bacterium]
MLRCTKPDPLLAAVNKLPISLPNVITSLRILLIPVLVAVFYFAPVEWRYLASS